LSFVELTEYDICLNNDVSLVKNNCFVKSEAQSKLDTLSEIGNALAKIYSTEGVCSFSNYRESKSNLNVQCRSDDRYNHHLNSRQLLSHPNSTEVQGSLVQNNGLALCKNPKRNLSDSRVFVTKKIRKGIRKCYHCKFPGHVIKDCPYLKYGL